MKKHQESNKSYWKGVYSDGLRVGFFTTYHEATPPIFKHYECAWLQEKKIWVGLLVRGEQLVKNIAKLIPDVFPELHGLRMLEKAMEKEEPFWSSAIRPALQRIDRTQWAMHVPYDKATTIYMKDYGARWNHDDKYWELDGTKDEVLSFLDDMGIPLRNIHKVEAGDILHYQVGAWTPYVMRIDDGDEVSTGVQPITVGGDAKRRGSGTAADDDDNLPIHSLYKPLTLLSVDDADISYLADKFDLLPHQVHGVRHFLERTTALNADDMGLGKTRQTIAAASHLRGGKVILCPASLKDNWKREIDMVLTDADVYIFDTQLPENQPEWLIVNYERTENMLKCIADKNWTFVVMAVDEAHYLKERQTQRTESAFSLAEISERRWLLTATPMLNGPKETWSLLRLSGHPVGDMDEREFTDLFTETYSDRHSLGGRISEWMIRRLKDEVLTLAGKFHHEPMLSVSHKAMSEYTLYMSDDSLTPLQKINFGRQWLEREKRMPIFELLMDLQPDAKAIVFCNFEASIKWFMKNLPTNSAVRLTGKETQKQRRDAVHKFQNQDECRWFIGNIKAAGVGLNLTAATYVFFVSRPWTPSDQVQAEDRAYRIGQDDRVEVYVPTIPGTIDEKIRDLLISKQKITEEVLAGALDTHSAQQDADIPDDVDTGTAINQ